VKPEPVTFMGVLNACDSVGWLEEGRCIHEHIIERGYESDLFVGSSLVDMYAKCGSIMDAQSVFNKMSTCNAVTWNAMLAGYASHGHFKEAFEHFERMCEEGVEMGMVTFVSLLSTCSHAGLVDEGLVYFDSMSLVHDVSPTVERYACMVYLFGRAGHLHEAEELIKTMSCESNAPVWKALLGVCGVYGDLEMGECVAEQVLRLDPGNSAGYVMLANIYAAAGNWDSCANIQQLRLERGLQKQPGCTWIELNEEVHSFTVDDQEHPQIIEICEELKRLSGQMKELGYVPDTKLVLHDVEDEDKMLCLGHHSEKLAIAFGLISTPPRTTLCIFKNLWICADCHCAI